MIIKIKPLLTCLTLALFALPSFAQVTGSALVKLTPVRVPAEYRQPTGKIEPLNAPTLKTASTPYYANFWLVYSDRDDNQTFTDKNLQQPFTKINFKEIFYVAEQTDKAVRLVVFDQASQSLDEDKGRAFFLPSAQDAGWISKKNLMLWSVSLVDTVNNYSRKAVAIKRLNNNEDFTKMIKRGVLDFYDAPDKNHENDKDVKLFQYLFIYKEENDMLLLRNINLVKANTIGFDLYGWVSKTQVQEWTSAICLRINFDDQAKEEREKSNFEPRFFRTETQAIDYKDGKKADPLIFNYSNIDDKDKDNPYLLGYPILSTTKDPAVFRTGYVTNTVDRNGKNIFSAILGADLARQFEKIKNEKEKINIVFVLDGAERNYFKTLINAIDANSSIGNTNATNNDYFLGAVIYNDLQCGDEDSFNKIKFKSSKDAFIESLQAQADKKPPCEINRSSGAPLTTALKTASDFFDNNKTTNIIIALGSVTDNDNLKKDAALKALISKKVKMFMYQTASRNTNYHDNYLRNGKYFLTQIADAADVNFKGAIERKERKKAELLCEGETCRLINTAIEGRCFFKDEGRQFTAQEINSNLKKVLMKIENDLNIAKGKFDQNLVGTGKDDKLPDSQENESRLKEFQSWLYDEKISPETIKQLSTMDNYQLFIEGYAALRPKSAVNNIFERNLFVSDKEFGQLYNTIEKVADALTQSDKRAKVVEACKDIIYTYMGPIDEKKKESYSIDAVYSMIVKLKGATTNPLFKKSVKDLMIDKITPIAEIDKMYLGFKQVLERLKQIKKSDLNRYEQDEQLFYWLPESKLTIE